MNTANQNAGCWPTRSQELLLQAALLSGQRCLNAWKEWRRGAELDDLDSGSQRLLPQLYHNLKAQGADDAFLEGYRDAYKSAFLDNELLLHTLSGLIKSFQDVGIPTMVLKGSALIPIYYRDSGLRPMADCDLLIPTTEARAAMSLLAELGWQAVYHPPEDRIAVSHSTPFENGSGGQLDLHWHLMWECWRADLDADFWGRAVPLQINNVSTLALSPTDQLLHVCWHGARWDHVPPIRWVADAMMIISNAETEIDWGCLVSEARSRHLSLPIKDCLTYLRDVLEAPVPAEILHALNDIPLFFNEQLSYRIATHPFKELTTLEILRSLSYNLVCLLSSTRYRGWPRVFVRFLQDKWKLKRLWHVPFILPLRSIKRVRKAWSNEAQGPNNPNA
jgi:putative nucleotidyltransferase-like protein